MGDMDGVRISFDDRLEDDEHRLLHTEEDDEDEGEGLGSGAQVCQRADLLNRGNSFVLDLRERVK